MRDLDFEAWLTGTRGVLAPTAHTYASALKRLRTVATEDDILYGDIEEIAERHPSVRDARRNRCGRAAPLRRAARLYREYREACPMGILGPAPGVATV